MSWRKTSREIARSTEALERTLDCGPLTTWAIAQGELDAAAAIPDEDARPPLLPEQQIVRAFEGTRHRAVAQARSLSTTLRAATAYATRRLAAARRLRDDAEQSGQAHAAAVDDDRQKGILGIPPGKSMLVAGIALEAIVLLVVVSLLGVATYFVDWVGPTGARVLEVAAVVGILLFEAGAALQIGKHLRAHHAAQGGTGLGRVRIVCVVLLVVSLGALLLGFSALRTEHFRQEDVRRNQAITTVESDTPIVRDDTDGAPDAATSEVEDVEDVEDENDGRSPRSTSPMGYVGAALTFGALSALLMTLGVAVELWEGAPEDERNRAHVRGRLLHEIRRRPAERAVGRWEARHEDVAEQHAWSDDDAAEAEVLQRTLAGHREVAAAYRTSLVRGCTCPVRAGHLAELPPPDFPIPELIAPTVQGRAKGLLNGAVPPLHI